MNTAVKVALRVRPLTLQEQINNCSECISYVPNEPQIGIVGSDKSFTFDHVFDEESTQRQVYEECAKELVERFIEGFNVTILAYGQTGSGKTYSMGTGLQFQGNSDHQAIVPRAAHAIFSLLDAQMESDPTMEYQVYVSFLELYNEELIDLLQTQPRARKDTIQVREDGFGGISWQGVKEHQVASAPELLDWLQKGSLCRTTASTDMNQTSSRSHAIFSVILKQQRAEEQEPPAEGEEDQEVPTAKTLHERPLKKLTSKFHFVDLAGSERLKRTRAVGDRAKEGISINSGLLALGNVISALGDEARKSSHVPYRDSKLTRLLQDSLGGNSATLMLACVSGADVDINETISTLVYANRARNIRNRVVINQDFRDANNPEIAQLRAEINRLKMENSSFRAMGSGPATQLDQRRAAEELRSLKGEVSRLRDRLRESSTELCDVLAERDTLLVERECTGDTDIEAHPIMMTYHHTVMQLKDRLIAAEDQALELQTLLSQRSNTVFGRQPRGPPSRQKAPSPFKRREPLSDDDHDADGEHDEQAQRHASPPRGRQPKRRSRQSSRAVSRFDFGAAAISLGIETAQLPTPPTPQAEPVLTAGGASSWFQSLKTEESQPLSAQLMDYSSTSSSSAFQRLPDGSDSSHSFSRRRRALRHGSGGVAETLDKAKEDIRRGLLLLKAEKHGAGMDMDILNLLDPHSTSPVQGRSNPGSLRRRDSMVSSMSSGSSRSRFPGLGLEDALSGGNPISPMRSSFPLPSPTASWKENAWKETFAPVKDQKVFQEAEQKAAETVANAMKAMQRFSFPISPTDTQQQQQARLAAAIEQQKAAAIALPESDAGSSFGSAGSVIAAPAQARFTLSNASHSVSSGGHSASKASADKPNYDVMLNEVQSGIAMKEELVSQLEKAEADYHHMRNQYEDEIRSMEDRIRDAEADRERENKIPGSIKMKYETKIKQLISELSDLQHKYADVSKIANEKRSLAEGQLRALRVAVETLKAEKQRMIKRMKEDAERIKEMNAANDREIQALRRSERAALDGRKKAEREIEQQRSSALLHRSATASSYSPQAKVNSFLKKPQTPKGITKPAKRNPRFSGASEKHESSIPTPRNNNKSPGSIRLQVAQKKQVIDRAIYGYISGQHAINVMEDMLKKRERLRTEKRELEQERQRVLLAQEEEAFNNGGLLLDFASEPQYMDDRLAMIDAEVAYINARIRALQAEAAALGFVTTIDKNSRLDDGKDGTTSDEEELMTKLIQKGMNDDAMGLPPGSGASVAFDSSITILKSMDLNESREFLEMLFEDMVTVRTHENGLQVQVANQEKVIDELKRALQAMRLAAVGATLGYEKRCDGLEKKLRQLGGSSDDISGKILAEGSSEEDENDAEVARLNLAAFGDSLNQTPSPILHGDLAKDLDQSEWTPLPDGVRPRPGSAAEAALDVKAKRASTIFDQLYEDAMKSSEEVSPKVGGTGGEFSRILMTNNERRVSWAGVPPSSVVDNLADATPEQPQQPHRLNRSISTSAISHRTSMERVEAKQRGNMSMYGHRRGVSNNGGSAGGQNIGPNGTLHRSSSSLNRLSSFTNGSSDAHAQQQQQHQNLPRGVYATTASSRQHTAETIAQRRSSTPISSPSVGPKSTARPRYNTGNGNGAPLTIQTGFANGYSPQQQTLRHSKSHQQPLNNNHQRQSFDARRTSTPSPGLTGKRFSDGGGPGSQAAAAAAAAMQRTPNGNGRPLSRIGAANMMTTTPTATNMVHGLVSPGYQHNHSAAEVNFGYGHHAHHASQGSSSQDHYHTHHHNSSSRRISGSWDDNQNVYERLASNHTQASQARVMATRSSSSMGHHAPHVLAPAGGSMMTTIIQQQSQGKGGPNDRMRMHRPSVDGLMTMMSASAAAVAAEAASGAGEDSLAQVERNWSSNSSSSAASTASTTTSTLTAATNSPTLQEHEEIRASIQSLSKAEVGPVF